MVWSLLIFEVRFQCWTDSIQTVYTSAWSGFGATRLVKLAVVRIQSMDVTSSSFRRLLKHMFLITAAMVMAIWAQLTCGVRWVTENQNSKRFWGLATGSNNEDYIFYSCLLSLLIRWLDDATHLNRPHQEKEIIHYYESFGYGGKCAIDKRFYRSNRDSVPAEEGSIIPIMGISLHSHHGHFTSSPTWAFHTMSYS
jgi:hypothetical protein